jgi:hypothetical protein
MNILADFQSAIQSINRITRSLSDFKRDTYDIINLYDEDNPEPYLNAIDCMFANLSYRAPIKRLSAPRAKLYVSEHSFSWC